MSTTKKKTSPATPPATPGRNPKPNAATSGPPPSTDSGDSGSNLPRP